MIGGIRGHRIGAGDSSNKGSSGFTRGLAAVPSQLLRLLSVPFLISTVLVTCVPEVSAQVTYTYTVSTPVENLTVSPIENLTGRRGDEPQVVATS